METIVEERACTVIVRREGRRPGGWIPLVCALAAASALVGCGTNELPDRFRGPYTMTRVFADDYTLTVGPNSISATECDINCPDPTITFTKIDCRSNECTVEGPDCTGTITLNPVGGRTLSLSLRVVPGATGEALERRQVSCYQYSGTTATMQ